MADITAICSGCGKTVLLSEYVSESAAVCRSCGGKLEKAVPGASAIDAVAPPSKPSVLRRGPGEAVTLRGEAVAPKPVFQHSEKVIPNTAGSDPDVPRSTSRLMGALVLLAASALFIGPQALANRYPGVYATYLQGRWIALAAVWLAVSFEAWRESAARGLLSTLFPPYVIFYALGRVERAWLRSAVLAAVLLLAAELYFLGSAALLRRAQASINHGIAYIENMIEHAGSAPAGRKR